MHLKYKNKKQCYKCIIHESDFRGSQYCIRQVSSFNIKNKNAFDSATLLLFNKHLV